MQPDRFLRVGLPLLAWVGAMGVPAAAAPPQVPPVSPEPPAFREFTLRVEEYLRLQKAPRQKNTAERKQIVERSQARAKKIREIRAAAKPGDIFTPAISEEFRKVIRSTVQSPKVRNTIREGAPLPGWTLRVNADYPEYLPVTTVPPTLLLRLPRLPPEVAYRIIGRDFVLQDTEARLVVDFIPGALP